MNRLNQNDFLGFRLPVNQEVNAASVEIGWICLQRASALAAAGVF
jgi:hypothetical protein